MGPQISQAPMNSNRIANNDGRLRLPNENGTLIRTATVPRSRTFQKWHLGLSACFSGTRRLSRLNPVTSFRRRRALRRRREYEASCELLTRELSVAATGPPHKFPPAFPNLANAGGLRLLEWTSFATCPRLSWWADRVSEQETAG
jgi:hypothetical protein